MAKYKDWFIGLAVLLLFALVINAVFYHFPGAEVSTIDACSATSGQHKSMVGNIDQIPKLKSPSPNWSGISEAVKFSGSDMSICASWVTPKATCPQIPTADGNDSAVSAWVTFGGRVLGTDFLMQAIAQIVCSQSTAKWQYCDEAFPEQQYVCSPYSVATGTKVTAWITYHPLGKDKYGVVFGNYNMSVSDKSHANDTTLTIRNLPPPTSADFMVEPTSVGSILPDMTPFAPAFQFTGCLVDGVPLFAVSRERLTHYYQTTPARVLNTKETVTRIDGFSVTFQHV